MKVSVPDTLLSGTPVGNVMSIVRHGLIPGKGESGASFTRQEGALFFTSSMEAACDYSTGGDSREPIAVVVVNTKGLAIGPDEDDVQYIDSDTGAPMVGLRAGEPGDDDDDLPDEIDDESGQRIYWVGQWMCRCAVSKKRIAGFFLDSRARRELGMMGEEPLSSVQVQLLGCDGYPMKKMLWYSLSQMES